MYDLNDVLSSRLRIQLTANLEMMDFHIILALQNNRRIVPIASLAHKQRSTFLFHLFFSQLFLHALPSPQ